MGEVHCRILSNTPTHASHTRRCPPSLPDAVVGLSSDLRELCLLGMTARDLQAGATVWQ